MKKAEAEPQFDLTRWEKMGQPNSLECLRKRASTVADGLAPTDIQWAILSSFRVTSLGLATGLKVPRISVNFPWGGGGGVFGDNQAVKWLVAFALSLEADFQHFLEALKAGRF